MDKNNIKQAFNAYLESAEPDDLEVIDHMVKGWTGQKDGTFNSYVGSWIQPEREWLDDQTLDVTIPVHKGIKNPLQIVHGGATATLLDIAMGSLANSLAPNGKASVTLEMKINYMKPGKGRRLRCRTSLLAQTTKTVVTEGRVFNDENELIAHATGTFYVIPVPPDLF
ncbi:PaaI family thioesterase [Alteribacillus sp. HJP-4]|uniref:PaaI family thioesterase n=1 Tax=Alteribacillus sp. HJP-4 TaxID=2775394 RepID=UPI0035CD0F9E